MLYEVITLSLRLIASAQVSCFESAGAVFGCIGLPMLTVMKPRRGNHEPARNIERVPLTATGIIGILRRAAAEKAPILKGSRPGMRMNVV